MSDLDKLLGLTENFNEFEFRTILNVKVPVLRELNAWQAAERAHLSQLVNERQIGIDEFYLRMFCVYTMHPQASVKVPWAYLKDKIISRELRKDIAEKIKSLLSELDEIKQEIEERKKLMSELFDPREDDLKNDPQEQTLENKQES